MENSRLSPFLESERQQTDHSLTAERDKTNESLIDARGKAERRTDKFVQKERVEADQTMSSSRIEADTHRDTERGAKGYDVKDERKISDDRLLVERFHADRAVEQERSGVDAAIDQERDLKNALMSHLLDQEREQTDENLQAERTRTDSEAHHASNLLSNEIAEHSKTKISLATRGEFLAIVSHDLKNPIGAIASCTEMLLGDVSYKEIDSEIKHWIEFIKRNADTSLRLISDILDMERIAEGKLQLRLDRCNIGDIVRESVESFVHAASAKNVSLHAAPSGISGEVVCDHDRVMQVISNLIGNALKFTLEGGSITLTTDLSETEVQVSVRDTGPGIPEEKKEIIFDRFAQLASKDRRGLGLGLYISKMLVEAHFGRLWVQSKAGQGSTFYFTLPRQGRKINKGLH